MFDLNDSFDKTSIKSAILAAPYLNAGTATGRALNLARTDVLVASAGYRAERTVVVVVTDGNTQETAAVLQSAATQMQGLAEVFAIGVGVEINTSELATIASSASNVFTITFADLQSDVVVAQIANTAACASGTRPRWRA